MSELIKLTDDAIQERLSGIKGWTVKNGRLHRQYQFDNFVEAFGYRLRVALSAKTRTDGSSGAIRNRHEPSSRHRMVYFAGWGGRLNIEPD